MANAQDNGASAGRGALWYVKQIVRYSVMALVIWGIWRAALKADEDMRRQQESLEIQIAEIDGMLQRMERDGASGGSRAEELRQEREELVRQRFDWSRVQPGWSVLAGFFYFLSTLPCAWFWQRTMHALGQQPRWPQVLRAYTVGNLGKYVPGKALVVVLRTSLIRGRNVSIPAAAASIFVETFTMMAVGAAVAAVLLLTALPGRVQWPWIAAAIGLALMTGLPTLPHAIRLVVRWMPGKRFSGSLLPSLDGLNGRLMVRGWTVMLVSWLAIGLSMWATARALPGDVRSWSESLADLPLLTACASLAVVVGFASFIPGGFGVRELVVTTFLAPQPQFGVARALVAAVLLRVVWMMSELVASGILMAAVRGPDSTSGVAPPPRTELSEVSA